MYELGKIVAGDKAAIEKALGKWAGQKIDDRRVVDGDDAGFLAQRTTLGEAVSVTGPGTFYGKEGEGYMRVNLACPRSQLEEGLRRMKTLFV